MRLRAFAACIAVVASVVAPSLAIAQSAAALPTLQALSPQELEALRPLAARGIAFLVRDSSAGIRARTTLLTRSRAPMAVVHDVIATPERYAEFLDGVSRTEVTSRYQNRIAFRLHADAGIFSSDTVGSVHAIGAQRIDGVLTESQLGPETFRWDLYPDGDGTLIAYTTAGDPTRANWFLRALTHGDPSTIAGIQMCYNGMLAFGVSLRAEILSGNLGHGAFETAGAAPVATEPPPLGPWVALAHDVVVGSAALNADRELIVSTVAMWVASPPDVVRDRLFDVPHYPGYWPDTRSVVIQSGAGNTRRFRSVVDSVLSHTEGEQEIVTEAGTHGPVVTWRGVSGDYAGVTHRWDLVASEGGGTTVLLTGGRETNGAGLVLRSAVGMAHWIVAGYSVAWKARTLRPFVERL